MCRGLVGGLCLGRGISWTLPTALALALAPDLLQKEDLEGGGEMVDLKKPPMVPVADGEELEDKLCQKGLKGAALSRPPPRPAPPRPAAAPGSACRGGTRGHAREEEGRRRRRRRRLTGGGGGGAGGSQ